MGFLSGNSYLDLGVIPLKPVLVGWGDALDEAFDTPLGEYTFDRLMSYGLLPQVAKSRLEIFAFIVCLGRFLRKPFYKVCFWNMCSKPLGPQTHGRKDENVPLEQKIAS